MHLSFLPRSAINLLPPEPLHDPRRFPRAHLHATSTTPNRSASDPLLESYNDVPYTSSPDPARHPDRPATLGTLLGLDVAPLARCRVLEFACGDGSNLIPAAATLPGASFVGFDFAARPLARARDMARDLGVANVRLLELDLRDLPPDLGDFDYIIVHGLYSWVPPEVRNHVMPAIARHLAPNGVAYVSYNAQPGCHLRAVAWDMVRYHTRDITDRRAKVAAARALLELVGTPAVPDDSTQQAMRAEVRNAARGSDSALAHDDLGDYNHPVYFHEFAADAAGAGLTFLAEAHLDTMLGGGLAPQVRQALSRLDRLAREQYLDFIHFRHFRESLLCHANAPSSFVLQPARALGLHVLPSLEMRRAAASGTQTAQDADVGAVRQCLLERWPRSISVVELGRWRAQKNATPGDAVASRPIEELVIELHVAGLVDLRSAPVAVAAVPGERPEIFNAARWIAGEQEVVPSLYHEALRFQDPTARKLLALLDGTRTRDEIRAALGGSFAGPSGAAQLDGVLGVLAGKALLVA